jgi:hypothetical protein
MTVHPLHLCRQDARRPELMDEAARKKARGGKRATVNRRVFPTYGPPELTRPTDDPKDRERGTPRRYPPGLMVRVFGTVRVPGEAGEITTRRRFEGMVSFETQFEDQARREARLEEMGLLEAPMDRTPGLEMRRALALGQSSKSIRRRHL